jgi:long-subunit acyl-CoA synthetase (AMP-forming)
MQAWSCLTSPQACNRMSLHCVPLYDTLGENAIEYIINHSEAVVAFVDTLKLPNLVKVRASGVCVRMQAGLAWPHQLESTLTCRRRLTRPRKCSRRLCTGALATKRHRRWAWFSSQGWGGGSCRKQSFSCVRCGA